MTVYRVCDQTDPGDTTVWKQQYNIQYEEESGCIGNIDPHKQTLVDLEYFVNNLRNKKHDVAIFIDANQNDKRCYRPKGHDKQFKSGGGFNINGQIDGSLKTFADNTGLVKALNNKHGPGNVERSHRACISPILNKLLTIQILIQKQTNGIVFDNDAKVCYDRIISGISLASIRRLGYSNNLVRMLGKLWEQLEQATYSSTMDKLLYGIGQGSCSSPIPWALLNQLIMTALREKFDCIKLVSVDNSTTSTGSGD
jgi:hypothetical protein